MNKNFRKVKVSTTYSGFTEKEKQEYKKQMSGIRFFGKTKEDAIKHAKSHNNHRYPNYQVITSKGRFVGEISRLDGKFRVYQFPYTKACSNAIYIKNTGR